MLAIFTFFNVLLYFSNAQLYFFEAHLTTFKPLYWYMITIAVGTVLLILRQGLRFPSAYYLRLIIWALVYMMMASASFIFISQGTKTNLAVFINSLEAMALLIMFTLFFRDQRIARWATYAVLIVVIFSVFMNYAEFFHVFSEKWQFSFVTGRSAGLYVNPNISGQQLVMGMVLSVFVVPKKLRWLYCLFVATGMILTFSRGAIILWMLAVLGLAWINVFVLPKKLSVTAIGVGVVLLSAALAAGDWVGVFKSSGLNDYLNSNTTSRISQSFLDQNDYSSMTRRYVAERGIAMILDKPLLGRGVGATQNTETAISPHNMYILLGIEYGIVGILMLCALIWLLWSARNERSRIIAVLYAVGGFFSHNNLDQLTVILVLALAIAGIGWHRIEEIRATRE